jgi:hypothetical protein
MTDLESMAPTGRLHHVYFDNLERTQAVLSTPGTLLDLLVDLVKHAKLPPMYRLLAGLGKCEDESIRWLATQLTKVSQQIGKTKLRMAIVNRDLPDLRHVENQILNDPENNDKVETDVKTLTLSHDASTLKTTRPFRKLHFARIQSELLRKAGATFLWIGYAVNDLLTKKTTIQAEEAVSGLPTALKFLYSRMLHGISDKSEIVTQILSWVVLVTRPLSLVELAAAIEWVVPDHLSPEQAAQDVSPSVSASRRGTERQGSARASIYEGLPSRRGQRRRSRPREISDPIH